MQLSRCNELYVRLCMPSRTGPLDVKSAQLADLSRTFAGSLKSKREYYLADQLYRSASAVGASIAEARGVVTRRHFTFKLQHALAECHEVRYWLERISHAGLDKHEDFQLLSSLQLELVKMLTSACKKLSSTT